MTLLDLNELVKFLRETRKFKPRRDDKLNKLKRMLKVKSLLEKRSLSLLNLLIRRAILRRNLEKMVSMELPELMGDQRNSI